MFASIAENLINYTFNVSSRLAFLSDQPFLTHYVDCLLRNERNYASTHTHYHHLYPTNAAHWLLCMFFSFPFHHLSYSYLSSSQGMNFDPFPGVQKHSDALFWYIAAPVMSVILPVFLWPDLQRLAHYVQKKMTTKKALEVCLTMAIVTCGSKLTTFAGLQD